ncbi:hypothetical protein [Roseospira goensis]|uniref:Uncharacterized protein n=1 Tax=Roseospira goensis TaxID=391922 RepID=A0A7W6WM32_9PROT|nr:hypothetical protein [Roseospira goensis]MBB4287504.1 hypothetical protein [Roseospira goensis]
MKDLHNNVAVVEVLPPAAMSADNVPAALDLAGFRSAVLLLHVGIGGITFTGSNKIEFKLTHSDDDATYEAVTADDLDGVDSVGTGGIVLSLTEEHAAASLTKIGYVGERRYLKLLADFSGTHGTGTPIAAVLVKGHPLSAPVA